MKRILKAFFCSTSQESSFRPPFFWATVLLGLLVAAVILQLVRPGSSYLGLIGILAGMVTALLTVYNHGRKNKDDGGDDVPRG